MKAQDRKQLTDYMYEVWLDYYDGYIIDVDGMAQAAEQLNLAAYPEVYNLAQAVAESIERNYGEDNCE